MIDRYRKSLSDQVFVLIILLLIAAGGMWAIFSWDTSQVESDLLDVPRFETFEVEGEITFETFQVEGEITFETFQVEGEITCVRIEQGETIHWECVK